MLLELDGLSDETYVGEFIIPFGEDGSKNSVHIFGF